MLSLSISAVIYSLAHFVLLRPPKLAVIPTIIENFLLGALCSIAQRQFGLLASVLLQLGCKLHRVQFFYNRNFISMIKTLRAVYTKDVVHRLCAVHSTDYKVVISQLKNNCLAWKRLRYRSGEGR